MPADTNGAPNRLIHETSPYLLQHAHNPVAWWPWGEEAFEKAKNEDKPVFLSIGYSTCHWCHVMAHESFEDASVAEALNRDFISIKVDREERPDIDGVYMRACQAMTGGGGWPTSIFMDANRVPFFAGTYYPKDTFLAVLETISQIWRADRDSLLKSGERLVLSMASAERAGRGGQGGAPVEAARVAFQRSFDPEYGGFGAAPKFPSPHNLMFLLYAAPPMAEKTLFTMYRGGIFDHIGFGFSRYSTDRYWLIPHFEKMLYDNALLAIAYLMAYETTGKELYRRIAAKIFQYLERELKAEDGGFFCAQDADSDGEEGKFYLFTFQEIMAVLGQADGMRFCNHYGITPQGNFEGRSVPNLLHTKEANDLAGPILTKLYEYRKSRTALHTDTKKLAAWNALAAAAYAVAARVLKEDAYQNTAQEIIAFLERDLTDGDTVFVGVTDGKRSGPGFLDDYAFYIFALIQMHQASLDPAYLARAAELAKKVIRTFGDETNGGFYFSGEGNETLIARPKESWDGAMPSGNSMMAYALSRLSLLTEDEALSEWATKQSQFMDREASGYPEAYGFYLYAALPVKKVVCRVKSPEELRGLRVRSDWAFRVTDDPAYPLLNDKITFYVCEGERCLPPTNEI